MSITALFLSHRQPHITFEKKSLSDLPIDILGIIGSFCEQRDIYRFFAVNRKTFSYKPKINLQIEVYRKNKSARIELKRVEFIKEVGLLLPIIEKYFRDLIQIKVSLSRIYCHNPYLELEQKINALTEELSIANFENSTNKINQILLELILYLSRKDFRDFYEHVSNINFGKDFKVILDVSNIIQTSYLSLRMGLLVFELINEKFLDAFTSYVNEGNQEKALFLASMSKNSYMKVKFSKIFIENGFSVEAWYVANSILDDNLRNTTRDEISNYLKPFKIKISEKTSTTTLSRFCCCSIM